MVGPIIIMVFLFGLFVFIISVNLYYALNGKPVSSRERNTEWDKDFLESDCITDPACSSLDANIFHEEND